MGRARTAVPALLGRESADRRSLGRPVVDEVHRTRLIESLASRWNTRLVLMIAPGGCGKTTAVAQAIRDNDLDPSGIDVYVRCRSFHLTASDVFHDLLRAGPGWAGAGDDHPSIDHVLTAVASASPIDICLHIDDVHHATAIDGLSDDLDRLVREMPFNGHLVVAGRVLPDMRIARLRAADEVVDIGPDDLAFDTDELSDLASSHDVAAEDLSAVSRWPAIARLTLVEGLGSTRDFLLEEVLDDVAGEAREAIAVALVAGAADAELLRSCGVPTLLQDLLNSVPLLISYDDGSFGAHDLWLNVLDRLVEPERLTSIIECIVDHRVDRGEPAAAVQVALDGRCWHLARRAMLAVLLEGDTHLDVRTVNAWLAALPDEEQTGPEIQLLRGVTARLAGGLAEGLDDVLAAAAEFRLLGDVDAETAACREIGTLSWLLARPDLREGLEEWTRDIIHRGGARMSEQVLAGRAATADIRGDYARALNLYEQIPDPGELGLRHMSTLALRLGDADAAEDYVLQLEAVSDSPAAAANASGMRWMLGDPEPLLRLRSFGAGRLGNRRNEFNSAAHVAVIGACLGVAPDVDAVAELVWERKRELTFLAVVCAAGDLLTSNEAVAMDGFERRITAMGIGDPLVRGEALRFLPYFYLLSSDLRTWFEQDAPLGPLHRRMLTLVSALESARSRPRSPIGDLPTPDETLTWLPLPWSVELAARLTDADDRRGIELATRLADACGAAVHRELRRLADATPQLSETIDALLGAIPVRPDEVTLVRVCGPLTVLNGDDPADLGRVRVRQLLELLVLRGDLNRSAIVEALWPDVEPATGRSNLRVTLSHLRKVLQPTHRGGVAHFHLRQGGDRIWLHRSEHLDVDAWQIDEALRRATAATSRSRPDVARVAYAEAVSAFTGPAYPTLRTDVRFAAEVSELEHSIVHAGCWLAEQHFASGDLDLALQTAEQMLALDPYSERSHDVVIGVHLGRNDLDIAETAIERCRSALDELGLAPSTATELLVRRHRHRVSNLHPPNL